MTDEFLPRIGSSTSSVPTALQGLALSHWNRERKFTFCNCTLTVMKWCGLFCLIKVVKSVYSSSDEFPIQQSRKSSAFYCELNQPFMIFIPIISLGACHSPIHLNLWGQYYTLFSCLSHIFTQKSRVRVWHVRWVMAVKSRVYWFITFYLIVSTWIPFGGESTSLSEDPLLKVILFFFISYQ